MIGDKKQGGYENSLGKAHVDTMGDIRNIAKWSARYLKSSLGIEEEVPHERVQAVFSKNKDFEKLVESGVPIVVLAGSKEIMFPATDVQKGVENLRAKGGKILLMITDMGHGFPHENPSGTAMTLALFRNKVGI
jgi:pimeloyl-ACP methyl ester carboxylesterase